MLLSWPRKGIPRTRSPHRQQVRPVLEALEDRLVPTLLPPGTFADLNFSLTTIEGDNQAAPINTPFPTNLVVEVRDVEADVLAEGVRVTFFAPDSGPSGTFANESTLVTAVTGSDGRATAPTFTANGIPGAYQVCAAVLFVGETVPTDGIGGPLGGPGEVGILSTGNPVPFNLTNLGISDLAVTKTGPITAIPGSPITYTITVANNGPSTVTDLTLTDTPPPAVLNPVFTPSTGSYDPATGAWTGLNLAQGQSATMTLSGTIDPSATGQLVNTATVTPPADFIDPNPGNNSASDSTTLVLDFGDAPISYGTLAPGGARHRPAGPILGALRDAEPDGQPNASATGDDLNTSDDEDGLVSLSPMTPSGTARLTVSTTGSGFLHAWLDFDRDGTFSSAERITAPDGTPVSGTTFLDLGIPASAVPGPTFLRLRLVSTSGPLDPTGLAADGEVEDHAVTIADPPATVYVDDDWASLAPGTDPDGAGPATAVGFDAFATLQQADSVVAPGGTMVVAAGTYTGAIDITRAAVVRLAGPVAIDAGGTSVRFAGSVDGTTGTEALTLTAVGEVSFGGPVGPSVPLARLEVAGARTLSFAGPVRAADLALSADGDIGTASNPVLTTASRLEASSASGGVFIRNTGALTLGGVSDLGGVAAAGAIGISASSPLTVMENVNAGADLTLAASEGPAGGDDVIVNPGVTVRSAGGSVLLQAGDVVLIANGALVQAATTVTLQGGLADSDNSGGVTIEGNLLAALLNVLGGPGADAITIRSAGGLTGTLQVDAGGGTNTLVFDLSSRTDPDIVYVTDGAIASIGIPLRVFYGATGGTFAGGVFVFTGAGADALVIQSTRADAHTAVFTQGGDDTIMVSSVSNLAVGVLSGLLGGLTVDGGGGSNQLLVSNSGDGSPGTAFLTDVGISFAPLTLFYRATAGSFARGIFLISGAGGDTLIVQSILAGSPTTLFAQAGDDTFLVAVTNASAYFGLLVDGGDGFDGLQTFDQSGGAVIHDIPTGPGEGRVEASYLVGAFSTIHYQHLERVASDVSAELSFIRALYRQQLGREAGEADLAFALPILLSQGREALARALAQSEEARRQLIADWFVRYLGRLPNPGEDTFFVDLLLICPREHVLAPFLAADTYYQLAGGTDEAFVRRLYRDLLQREGTDAEVAATLASLAVRGRQEVVLGFLQSEEYRALALGELYGELLRRGVTQADLDSWVFGGGELLAIESGILASDEFFSSGR